MRATNMAAPRPPVAPHGCTCGSAYGCTAAVANAGSDDRTGDRAAVHTRLLPRGEGVLTAALWSLPNDVIL